MEKLRDGRPSLKERRAFALGMARLIKSERHYGTATEEDKRRRMDEQFQRYLEHSSRGRLTPEWRGFGSRHALEILEIVVFQR